MRTVASLALVALLAIPALGQSAPAPQWLTGLRVHSVQAPGGNVVAPAAAVDGDPATEVTFEWGNGGLTLVLDLGGPRAVNAVRITSGSTDRLVWLTEVWVGPDPEHLRPLLGRPVNLSIWRPSEATEVALPLSAGRYLQVRVAGGGPQGRLGEVEVRGIENRPERHLMCWASDLQRDFLEKLAYLHNDLGATDLWLDGVETAFPQSTYNGGFAAWVDSGLLEQLRERGIRYWLGEHEGFCQQVNDPADLRDDRAWETTLRQARVIYARAKALGFRGLVMDAEDYGGVTEAARQRYADVADAVDGWCFSDEFGPSGAYYRRGLAFGKAMAEVWGGPLLQVYEARMYAGIPGCRDGNYWWLRGIHDAGVEVWIATEKTYGAGADEIAEIEPEHLRHWFVRLPEFMPRVHDAFPFAARVLPGFHPWNARLRKPCYLPRYLDEQLTLTGDCALGCWIYNEGNPRAGDPRETLDEGYLRERGLAAEDYLDVFRRHPVWR